jgi:hypothetical protein
MSTDTNLNPYASPADVDDGEGPFRKASGVDFAPILWQWERLRIVYNAILVPLVLAVTFLGFPAHAHNAGYWTSVAIGGFVANVCFFTAPARSLRHLFSRVEQRVHVATVLGRTRTHGIARSRLYRRVWKRLV